MCNVTNVRHVMRVFQVTAVVSLMCLSAPMASVSIPARNVMDGMIAMISQMKLSAVSMYLETLSSVYSVKY